MCGRFTLTVSLEDLKKHFQLKNSICMRPRYNIAATQPVPVIRTLHDIEFLNWGFIPGFRKKLDENTKGFQNARIETIQEKPSFKQAVKWRRCLILADGFYEWKLIGREKQPFYVRRKDKQVFAFAGIWEDDSCAILTKEAVPFLKELHDRMPVILSPEDYENWLTLKGDVDKLILKLKDAPLEGQWEIFPVSSKMNVPEFDTLDCIRSLH